jgi:hypothetical protein
VNAGRDRQGTLGRVNTPIQPFLVLDCATVRFRWNAQGTTLTALTSRREILATVPVDRGINPRAAAFAAMDKTLQQAVLTRVDPHDPLGRVRYRVGLYNPFTGEVALGGVPDTVTYATLEHDPLPVDGDGTVATLTDDGAHLVWPDGTVLSPRELTFASMTRLALAHQAA